MEKQKKAADIMYGLEQAYNKKICFEEILEIYKMIENKEETDEYSPGKSYLHFAASFADYIAVAYLLRQGFKPNLKGEYSRTPLHYLANTSTPLSYDNTELLQKDYRANIEKTAQALLDARASVLLRDENRDDLCYHLAGECGNLAFINTLIKNKCKLDMTDRDGRNLLHILVYNPARSLKHCIKYAGNNHEKIKAAEEKLEEIFKTAKALIELGLDPQSKDKSQKTAADYAVESELGKLAVLLKGEYAENDSSLNDKIAAGGKTLHIACKNDDLKAVEALIRLGADINEVSAERDFKGLTPLAAACRYLQPDCVNALLNAGADPNFRSGEEGRSALYFMLCGGYGNEKHKEKNGSKIIKSLIDHKLDINGIIDENEDTPLIFACARGYNCAALKQLIRQQLLENKDCKINIANKNGITPLMNIVMQDCENIENDLILLLENGADMTAKDAKGSTALMYAANNENKAAAKTIADLMFSFGDPLPKAVNNEGKSALNIAVEKDNEDLVKYLLGKM
jgi:ankyrin repeat protein